MLNSQQFYLEGTAVETLLEGVIVGFCVAVAGGFISFAQCSLCVRRTFPYFARRPRTPFSASLCKRNNPDTIDATPGALQRNYIPPVFMETAMIRVDTLVHACVPWTPALCTPRLYTVAGPEYSNPIQSGRVKLTTLAV